MDQKPYFPLFVSLDGKKAVVIGGGPVAARRVKTLLEFGAVITVIAPEIEEEIRQLPVSWYIRPYQKGDCRDAYLVTAAADSRQVNHQVYEECREGGQFCSVADCPGECSFYFPAVALEDGLTVGITSGGQDHRKVKEAAARIRTVLSQPEE